MATSLAAAFTAEIHTPWGRTCCKYLSSNLLLNVPLQRLQVHYAHNLLASCSTLKTWVNLLSFDLQDFNPQHSLSKPQGCYFSPPSQVGQHIWSHPRCLTTYRWCCTFLLRVLRTFATSNGFMASDSFSPVTAAGNHWKKRSPTLVSLLVTDMGGQKYQA